MTFRVLGTGSPLVDYTAQVDETFLKNFVPGTKGGTIHVNAAERDRLFAAIAGNMITTPGGAAANTICALGKLGVETAFLGRTGEDEAAEFFRRELDSCGVSCRYLLTSPGVTGYCLSLVTPDAERTMRSDLGVSTDLTAADFAGCDFRDFTWLMVEGYMMETPDFEVLPDYAASDGCAMALDFSSIELVTEKQEMLLKTLNKVQLLFCNNDEAAALTGCRDPQQNLQYLAAHCPQVALKLGADGSLVRTPEGTFTVPAADRGKVVDTTAAGDHYAAGFLYGLSQKLGGEGCGRCGSLLGSAVCAFPGSRLPGSSWESLKNELNDIVNIYKGK